MILQTRASTLAVLFFADSIGDKTRVSARYHENIKRNIIANFVPQNTPEIPDGHTVSPDGHTVSPDGHTVSPDGHTVSNDRTCIKTSNPELN